MGSNPASPTRTSDNGDVTKTIWTIPNIVSFTRLVGVGFIIYYGIFNINDVAVFWVFVWGSVTDWLDGFLARKLNQMSELGATLDPIADRLYIVAALIVLLYRNLVPLWIVVAIVLREIFMGLHLLRAARAGFEPPAVHYVGKAGTLLLLYAVPFIFLGASTVNIADFARWIGLAFLGWGVVTYWVAGLLYVAQYQRLTRA